MLYKYNIEYSNKLSWFKIENNFYFQLAWTSTWRSAKQEPLL